MLLADANSLGIYGQFYFVWRGAGIALSLSMAVFILTYGETSASASPRNADHARIVAGAARVSGIAFLEGVRRGWGKREIASWLLGSYARATSFTQRGERVARLEAGEKDEASSIDEDAFVDLLFTVRAHVAATLDLVLRSPLRPWFVEQATERGHLIRSEAPGIDGEAASELWLPRNRPGMRLEDRVLSLFACDYLARPASYDRELFVCRCDAIGFDRDARQRGGEGGICGAHDRASGVVASRNGVDPSDEDFDPITEPEPFLLTKKKDAAALREKAFRSR